MRVILTNAQVIDCVHPRPRPRTSVLVEQGRITAVLDQHATLDTRDTQVIDLQGAYLLRGLWDVHIHPDYLAASGVSLAE